MNALRDTLAVAGKELQVFFKDRGSLAVLFLLPLVLATIFGSLNVAVIGSEGGEGEEAMSLPVYVVNLDDGPYGEQVTAILEGIDVLDVSPSLSVEEANRWVADREGIAAIVIPAGFSAGVDGHEPGHVQVIVDPTQEQYGAIVTGIMNEVVAPVIVQGEIQYGIRSVMDASGLFANASDELRRATEAQTMGAIMTQLQRMQDRPWIAVRAEDPEGIEAKGDWNPFTYTMPGFSVMFAFFLVGSVAQTIWLEKEVGSFRRLLAAPIQRGAVVGGKILAYVLIVCLQVLVLFTVGSAAFDMPLGDSPMGLVLLTLATALTSSGMGILVATLTGSSRQADTLGSLLAFLLAAVGGCIYPLYHLKGFVSILPRLVPQGHAMIGFNKLLNEGAGVIQVLPQIGVLLGMATVFFLVGTWRFKFD
jgi:ABC-2 type transport system permease protein